MLTRKQAREQKLRLSSESGAISQQTTNGGKRAADDSPCVQPQKKRSALGDITNNLRNVRIDSSKKQQQQQLNSSAPQIPPPEEAKAAEDSFGSAAVSNSAPADVSMLSTVDESIEQVISNSPSNHANCVAEGGLTTFLPSFGIRTDYDKENELDPYHVPHYAQDIFDYYNAREAHFAVGNYLERQPATGGITRQMRAILVDWMVEIQEDFELNHETLYQAVKMTDLYLDKTPVAKEQLQLVGATALLISAKFDERQPPLVDDFLYICDDAYNRKQLLQMEMVILKSLQFDIGFPLSYRFLRRFAKTTKATMQTLTLARYILETSLMHYEFVQLRDSLIAAAALLLALRMTDKSNWTDLHQQYSGYSVAELEPLMWRLNRAIKGTALTKSLKNIRTKYAHEVFYEVANIRPLHEASTTAL